MISVQITGPKSVDFLTEIFSSFAKLKSIITTEINKEEQLYQAIQRT